MEMHNYIFYTAEGSCLAPDQSDVENLQILGFEKGNNPSEALALLAKNNPWIADKGYSMEGIRHRIVA